jgi:hypothetical protein
MSKYVVALHDVAYNRAKIVPLFCTLVTNML